MTTKNSVVQRYNKFASIANDGHTVHFLGGPFFRRFCRSAIGSCVECLTPVSSHLTWETVNGCYRLCGYDAGHELLPAIFATHIKDR